MAGISKEQLERDEASLATFLIFFDVVLLGVLLFISIYQSFN